MTSYIDLTTKQPTSQVQITEETSSQNKLNIAFAVVVLCYECLALPIYGVLFRLGSSMTLSQDYGGVLLMGMAAILLVVGNFQLI